MVQDLTGQFETIRDPWETNYAALVPRFSGGSSAICSLLIIYVILRSHKKLSTTYHRIMASMSVTDFLASVAMTLTSLPMPKEMPHEKEYGFSWAGTRLGTTQTCNVQGFFFQFGFTATITYNTILCVYYVCSLVIQMSEKRIHRFVEPVFHAVAILFGLVSAIPPLFLELYNPSDSTYAWCGITTYPHQCTTWDDVDCVRGNGIIVKKTMVAYLIFVLIDVSIIVISLALVIRKVFYKDKKLNRLTSIHRSGVDVENGMRCRSTGRALGGKMTAIDEQMDLIQQDYKSTRAAVIQASAYFFAMILVLFVPFVRALVGVSHFRSGNDASYGSQGGRDTSGRIDKAILVLLPMQGVLNFIIFISHKVYNYQRVMTDASICTALKALFLASKEDEPFFISRISMVDRDNCLDEAFSVDLDDDGDSRNSSTKKNNAEIISRRKQGDEHSYPSVLTPSDVESISTPVSMDVSGDTQLPVFDANDCSKEEEPGDNGSDNESVRRQFYTNFDSNFMFEEINSTHSPASGSAVAWSASRDSSSSSYSLSGTRSFGGGLAIVFEQEDGGEDEEDSSSATTRKL
mmetsp:Transcript_25393/g.38815  ORF Transcript_25393/g.38815 Transcript_25393/m.38815 type:complete len:575 (+) Transcript_25393:331-2055(+)